MQSTPQIPEIKHKQSAFTLTAIQVTGATSIPMLSASIQLVHQYRFWGAFWILIAGNILAWAVAMTIISMMGGGKKNTLENASSYIGHYGTYPLALVLIISAIAGFVLQIDYAVANTLNILDFESVYQIDKFVQYGVLFGLISTLACMEGMKGLKLIAVVSFPVIILSFAFLLFSRETNISLLKIYPSTVGALAISLGTSLSIVVDYPTFFQHSRSIKSSRIAATLIQGITLLIGVGGLYLGEFMDISKGASGWGIFYSEAIWLKIFFILMVLLSCVCVNSVNVYSASIGWELLSPQLLTDRKEYLILGLGLTGIFVLFERILPAKGLLSMSDIAMTNLCLVLVIGYFGVLIQKHKASRLDKVGYFFAWICGSIICVIASIRADVNVWLLLTGFGISVVIPLAIVFLQLMRRRLLSSF